MTLPPVWVPKLRGTWKSATAAADPAEDPPGVRFGSCGLVVAGPEFNTVNSVVVVLPYISQNGGHVRVIGIPKIRAPALRSIPTIDASAFGRFPLYNSEPYSVGMS